LTSAIALPETLNRPSRVVAVGGRDGIWHSKAAVEVQTQPSCQPVSAHRERHAGTDPLDAARKS
jgi:hypothetical protein